MINITSQAIETISLITTTESSETTTTTNTNTNTISSSSSSSSSTSSTISLTNNNNNNNNSANNNIDDNSIIAINCTIDINSLVTDENNDSLPILAHTNSANNSNISLDSDSSNSSANPNLSTNRDISCIDLTEGDDDIEIINEKISFRPHKKRKREHRSSSSTSTSCCPHRPCRNSPRESSTTPNHRTSSSPRSVNRRSAHHHQPLTPPRLLPVLSLQEQLSISPPRSDSFIVDLANSPSPSTSSSSNKSNTIDILVESVPKRKNIVEIQKPQEPVRYKIVKCPICLEEDHKILAAGGEIVVTVCGHVYCKSCIQQAIKTNHCCPNCRKKLTQKNYHRIFL